jgi:hypothetical protein
MDTVDSDTSSIGGKVGSRIAGVVADATVATRQRLAPFTAGVAQIVLRDFTNHVSDEVRSMLGPIWTKVANDPDTPEELRPLFRAVGGQRGQAFGWVGGAALGGAMGGGLLDLINNALRPVVGPLLASSPNLPMSVGDAAAAAQRGISPGYNYEREAATQGMSGLRFGILRELSRTLMSIEDILALVNRGEMTTEAATQTLRRMGFSGADTSAILLLRHAELSGPDVAAMWNRGIFDEGTAIKLGARVGLNATQVRQMLELGGEPPGTQELLLAWRRGVIDEKRVDRALRQSPIRFEWLDVIKDLRWLPFSVEEAANAVNQGHMSIEDARKVARENGLKPEQLDVLIANAGLPPGPQEALDWVNRGLITPAQFRGIFLESRVKNKYIDLYLASRYETMPPETIRLMYSRGAMTREEAARRFAMRGYDPETTTIVLDGASAEKTEKTRDLTTAQVLELYGDRLISLADALAMLQGLGFDAQEAQWQADIADMRRVRRYVNAVVTRIRSAYVTRRIDDIEAGAALDSLGLPAEFKDEQLALWDVERTTVTRELTTAQIIAAVKKGVIEARRGLDRIMGQGYSEDDAITLMATAGVAPA